MKRLMATPDARLVGPAPRSGSHLRLFCFPHAGGGAAMFYAWSTEFPPEIQTCPVHLPGRETRLADAPFTRLGPLVQELASLLAVDMATPLALFGHSMGALIAFELARELRRRDGPTPVRLFVSGARAPQVEDQSPALHDLPESTFIERLLSRYNGIPPMVLRDPELMRLFLPVLRADLELVENYKYQQEEALECPISVFGGSEDPDVCYDDLSAWREQTRGTFKLRMMPGDHFFLNGARAPTVRAIVQDLMGNY
jgi:surfactin synthase thioesterase subunit